jgi:hypothetical protein
MSSRQLNPELKEKLEDLRGRLLGDLGKEDLDRMQIQVSLLSNLDLMMKDAEPGHHHDHMDDHDHAALFLKPTEIMQRPSS